MFDWSASSPPFDGRTVPSRNTAAEEVLARWQELLAVGAGYLEISHAESTYPWLTLGFEAGQGAAHRFTAEDECDLLVGDQSVDPLAVVEVFHGEEYPASFSGDFVSTVDRLDLLLRDFLSGRDLSNLGSWERL